MQPCEPGRRFRERPHGHHPAARRRRRALPARHPLCPAGARRRLNGLGSRDAGYYALDALRIEAGRRAWGAELGPDETPFEAGLAYAVSLDKSGFIGREVLLAARGQPLRKKLVTLVLDDPAAHAWGGETVSVGGESVGELSSVGWGWAASHCVALGYLRGDAAAVAHAGTPVTVDLWGEAVGARAWDRWMPRRD